MKKNDLIFIIDDDPVYVNFLKLNLFKLGFSNVKTFNTGEQYLDNIYQLPQVVLMDYNLEDTTGKTLLSETLTFDSDILVIMISSQKSIEFAVETLKIGALDYLIKDETIDEQLKQIFVKIEALHKYDDSSRKRNRIVKIGVFVLLLGVGLYVYYNLI